MRFAAGCLGSALVLASGDALGMVGAWGFPAAVVLVLCASVVAAIAMEDRELLSVKPDGVASASIPRPTSHLRDVVEFPSGEVA